MSDATEPAAGAQNNFLVCGIPIERLKVHLRRLCEAGHKVGVIRQTETRALKAAGGPGSSKLFTRELRGVYTKTTMIDDGLDAETAGEGDDAVHRADIGLSSHLVSISECAIEDAGQDAMRKLRPGGEGGGGAQADVMIGMVAIDAATASLVHDWFLDGPGRPELEARLAQLQPQEILAPDTSLSRASGTAVAAASRDRPTHESAVGLSVETERLIRKLGTGWRVERRPSTEWGYVGSVDRLCSFYQPDPAKAVEADHERTATVLNLERPVMGCLGALLGYLENFGLESALQLTSNFRPFRIPNQKNRFERTRDQPPVLSVPVLGKAAAAKAAPPPDSSPSAAPPQRGAGQSAATSSHFDEAASMTQVVDSSRGMDISSPDEEELESDDPELGPLGPLDGPMELDALTLSNLEVLQRQGAPDNGSRTKGSLFWLMNRTKTSFGARQLRKWLLHPLRNRNEIEARLAAVAELHSYGGGGYLQMLCSTGWQQCLDTQSNQLCHAVRLLGVHWRRRQHRDTGRTASRRRCQIWRRIWPACTTIGSHLRRCRHCCTTCSTQPSSCRTLRAKPIFSLRQREPTGALSCGSSSPCSRRRLIYALVCHLALPRSGALTARLRHQLRSGVSAAGAAAGVQVAALPGQLRSAVEILLRRTGPRPAAARG